MPLLQPRAPLRFAAATVLALSCWACAGGGGGEGGGGSPPPAAPPASTPLPPANRPPFIAKPLPNPAYGTARHAFSFDVSQGGVFVDPDGDALSYDLTLMPGTWINVSGPLVSGTPPEHGELQVSVFVTDGHGGSVNAILNVNIQPNSAPQLARQLGPLFIEPGVPLTFDVTQGGTTFVDADGDAVSYELRLASPARGLALDGARVVGTMSATGAVNVTVTARDAYGGSTDETLAVAVVGPEPGEPLLPNASYVYADAQLELPMVFWSSSVQRTGPLFDRTPAENPVIDAGATLGRVLFYDKRLSLTNTHACGSCHLQAHGFAAPDRFATGVPGVHLTRNTMALANVRYSYQDKYFSDERVRTLEALVLQPIEEPTELDNTLELVEERIRATRFYAPLFAAAGLPMDRDGIAKALAQFVRALLSYRSEFDRAFGEPLSGVYTDPATVLSDTEMRGALLFGQITGTENVGCTGCHGDDTQTVPFAMNIGFDLVSADPGAGGGAFRAASLRNIAVTAPYMHDGRFATLREVLDHYDRGILASPDLTPRLRSAGELPRRFNLSDDDKAALEAFLRTLTDDALLADPRFADPFPVP
jgi:cytochrome c peroxidase